MLARKALAESPKSVTRPAFYLRMCDALIDRLRVAAEMSGRSMSEEAEHRLARSFDIDDIRAVIREEMRAKQEHFSDCALHNASALPVGSCDCGLMNKQASQTLD